MFPSLDLLRLRLYTLFFRSTCLDRLVDATNENWCILSAALLCRRDVMETTSLSPGCCAKFRFELSVLLCELPYLGWVCLNMVHGTHDIRLSSFIIMVLLKLANMPYWSILCIYTYSEYTPFLSHFCCNHDNVLIWRQMILYTVKRSNAIVYSWGKRFLGLGLLSTAPCRKVLLRWLPQRCKMWASRNRLVDWLIWGLCIHNLLTVIVDYDNP